MSDFSLYGGLYRHVHLAYVPAVSLESVHIAPSFLPGSAATVKVKARLYNPAKFSGNAALTVEIADPAGKTIAHIEQSLPAWTPKQKSHLPALPRPRFGRPRIPISTLQRHSYHSLRQ